MSLNHYSFAGNFKETKCNTIFKGVNMFSNFFKRNKSSYISFEEILSLNKQNQKDFVLIDLRTPREIQETGIIPNAIIKDYHDVVDFEFFIKNLDKNKEYIVYCKVGGRSSKAARKFKANGLKVKDYSGGMDEWLSKNLKTIKL